MISKAFILGEVVTQSSPKNSIFTMKTVKRNDHWAERMDLVNIKTNEQIKIGDILLIEGCIVQNQEEIEIVAEKIRKINYELITDMISEVIIIGKIEKKENEKLQIKTDEKNSITIELQDKRTIEVLNKDDIVFIEGEIIQENQNSIKPKIIVRKINLLCAAYVQ